MLETDPVILNVFNDGNTKPKTIKTQPLKNNDKLPQYTDDSFRSQISRLSLELKLLYSAFDKTHKRSHVGLHLAQYNFNQFGYITFLKKWLSFFFHDCVDCQMHKYKNMKQNKAAIWPFSKHSICFNHSVFIDPRKLLNHVSDGNYYIFQIFDHYSEYNITVSTPNIFAQYVVNALFHHWISKPDPP